MGNSEDPSQFFSEEKGKVNIICSSTKDLASDKFNAGSAVKKLSEHIGGRGGGRKDMAQGGGKDVKKIDDLIKATPDIIKELL